MNKWWEKQTVLYSLIYNSLVGEAAHSIDQHQLFYAIVGGQIVVPDVKKSLSSCIQAQACADHSLRNLWYSKQLLCSFRQVFQDKNTKLINNWQLKLV